MSHPGISIYPHIMRTMWWWYTSLERANLNSFNVSSPDFCIWQHIGSKWSTTHIKKLVNVQEILLTALILPFEMNSSSEEEGPSLTGKFLTHTGTYMGFLSMIFIASMEIYCLKKFLVWTCLTKGPTLYPSFIITCHRGWWCRGTTLLQKWGKVENPVRPHKNHDLHMEWETTRLESHCKQLVLSKAVLVAGSLATKTKILQTWLEHMANC